MSPIDPTAPQGDGRPDPDVEDVEDPTGIRALLQGLPDPGPMPADLVARIETRLAVEQSHHRSAGHGIGARGDSIVDLAAERSRRRPGRTLALLGAAAAGLMVTTVAVGQLLDGGGIADTSPAAYAPASSGAQSSAEDAGGAADESGPGESIRDEDAGADRPGLDAGDLAVQDSDGAEAAAGTEDSAAGSDADGDDDTQAGSGPMTASAFPPPGADLVLPAPLGPVAEDYAAQLHSAISLPDDSYAAVGSGLTEAQAKSCWSSVPQIREWTTYAAAPATQDDTDVVVLLGLADTGDGRAWLLPLECTVRTDVEPLDDAPLAP